MGFFRRPQQVWFRRVNFQVHLWAGIILAVYVTVIGVTGSILVFGAELTALEFPNGWPAIRSTESIADISTVIANLAAAYPHTHVISVTAPTESEPVFIAVMQRGGGQLTVACHPLTGRVLEELHRQASKLDWIYDLHENLLAHRTGRKFNGAGGMALVLLAFSGLVNWWPGVQRWRRGLAIDFRRSWRRINFDIHSAVGFWSVGFLLVWASTGVYFTWPEKVLTMIGSVSPIVNSMPPAVSVDPDIEMQTPDFRAMLMQAYALDPGTRWKELVFPSSRRSPFEMIMSRAPGIGRDYEDTLYFNPYHGRYISTWQYGVNKSIGDWFIWLQIPLHFGTHWGLLIKFVWAAFGLALPTLAITGLLMYWNRVLSKKWRTRF